MNHSHIANDFPAGHCDDTDPFLRDWDKDCDGIIENSSNSALDEVGIFCWTYIKDDILGNPGSETDKNYNLTHDCFEVLPCSESPCCKWENINNNVMAYNKFQEAFTYCQSLSMIETTHMVPSRCQYVESVGGGCPPPSAFITQTAMDLANNDQYCNETLVLRPSFNETQYKCDLMLDGSQVVVFSTGWKSGPAQNIIFTTGPSWNNIYNQNLLVLEALSFGQFERLF